MGNNVEILVRPNILSQYYCLQEENSSQNEAMIGQLRSIALWVSSSLVRLATNHSLFGHAILMEFEMLISPLPYTIILDFVGVSICWHC